MMELIRWWIATVIIVFLGSLQVSFCAYNKDLQGLQALYTSTNGKHWWWRRPYSFFGNPWNVTSPTANPCADSWQGINCSSLCVDSSCFVTELVLTLYNLDGTLPPEISLLSQLTRLDLSFNRIFGTISLEWGNITTLQKLNVGHNRLNGSIPESLGQLLNLSVAFFNFNNSLVHYRYHFPIVGI